MLGVCQCCRTVANGRKVGGAVRGLQFECAKVLHEAFHCRVVRQCYGGRRIGLGLVLWRWITLEAFWVFREWIEGRRELNGMTKGVGEKIDESVFQWFGHFYSISLSLF